MKKRLSIFIVMFLFILVGVVVYRFNRVIDDPLVEKKSNVLISVKEGDSFYSLLDSLKDDKVIKSTSFIKVYLKYKNISPSVKPGNYEVDPNISLINLINILDEGNLDANTVTITIPEGYEFLDIVNLLDEKGVISKEDFIAACDNYSLPAFIKQDENIKYKLEGYLFPDTYEFNKNESGDFIITKILDRFIEVYNEALLEIGQDFDETKISDIVTLASIVEKEALTEDDKKNVAGVFNHRLEISMPLQSDVTVLYALGIHKELVLYKDLEVDSLYNTYKYIGLPIGPVCNPGKVSIMNAIKPMNTDNIYFIIVKDGPHLFTDDYNEFLDVKDTLN